MSSTSSSSTINQAELDKFSAMAADWWNPNGVCKPLHSLIIAGNIEDYEREALTPLKP